MPSLLSWPLARAGLLVALALTLAATSPTGVAAQDTTTFEAGSLIIPMDLEYQDKGALQAYGLIYQLLQNGVPISWVIDPGKTWHAAPCNTGGDNCSWDCGEEGSGVKCAYPTGSPDFYAHSWVKWDGESSTEWGWDHEEPSDNEIVLHGYRAGPFVVDVADAADAKIVIDAWNDSMTATRSVFKIVTVHEAAEPFSGFVAKNMVAAPTIAVFSDGNEHIAGRYLQSAGIPQSNGNEFLTAVCGNGDDCGDKDGPNPDMLTVEAVMGPMGTCAAPNFDHSNGALFTDDGVPAYCQIMSMHWDVKNRTKITCDGGDLTYHGSEVVAEVREFLNYPTHFFAECQAVNAYENTIPPVNDPLYDEGHLGHYLTTQGVDVPCDDDNDCPDALGEAKKGYKCFAEACSDGVSSCCDADEGKERGAGFLIGEQPDDADIQVLSPFVPYNQFDGWFGTTGGSEKSYNLSQFLGTTYKNDLDITFLTGAQGPDEDDVWMTGYLDGVCSIEDHGPCAERVGKISYLGGHEYTTATPLSGNRQSQGTRLFLNSLFEADCVIAEAQPWLALLMTAPEQVAGSTVTLDVDFGNYGQTSALQAELTITLPAGATLDDTMGDFESYMESGTDPNTITWQLGNLAMQETGTLSLEVTYPSAGDYDTAATLTYRSGNSLLSQTSNTATVTVGADSDGDGCSDSYETDVLLTNPNLKDTDGDGAWDCNDSCPVLSNPDQDLLTDVSHCGSCGNACSLDNATAACAGGSCSVQSCDMGWDNCNYDPADGCEESDLPCSGGGGGSVDTVKPNILVVFDTSGSMLDSRCDGQSAPVGDGADGTASRIYNLKAAIRESLFFVGTDEANFGLMRFPQFENACNLTSCDFDGTTAGYYNIGPFHSGGANGNSGCVMSTHSDELVYGGWFDDGAMESIVVPVTDSTMPLSPPGSWAFDPSDANIPEQMRWLNQTTQCSDNAITDPEIQSIRWQYTGLGRSLFYARMYFDNYVIPKDDPAGYPCRQNIVILITDGEDTCDNDLTVIPSKPTSVADCDDGSGDEFSPTRQACLLYVQDQSNNHPYPIKTYVITQTGLAGANDAIALAGGTDAALEADFTNQDEVKAALLTIIAEAVPDGETCNGLDDNCNGLQDEGVSNSCAFDGGTLAHCAVETCDGVDEDCDGETDEGHPSNACGGPCGDPVPAEIPCNSIDDDCDLGTPDVPSACACAVELCDGISNDCDGIVDEDLQDPLLGQACGSTVGACSLGTTICSGGGIICSGQGPVDEICDVDEPENDQNCNGINNDGIAPTPCDVSNGFGTCSGSRICDSDGNLSCTARTPTAELCNGLDDDCNGETDENLSRGCQVSNGFGTCFGIETCMGATWVGCDADTPAAEVCDGSLDEDCDGLVDEMGSTTCGQGICEHTVQNCQGGAAQVCDPMEGVGTEACNNLDDNCNGDVDEDLTQDCYTGPAGTRSEGECQGGTRTCSTGVWGACTGDVVPSIDVCDGDDNDCDGSSDENLGQTTCGLGVCDHTVDNCIGGVPQVCDAQQGAAPESCDTLDNDCNGVADGISRECYTHGSGCTETSPGAWSCTGACTAGTDSCPVGSGAWTGCQFDVGPSAELCDGQDNDCNGEVDENLSRPCQISNGFGACFGTETCSGGSWIGCDADTPAAEVCDGSDDEDCDGLVDEMGTSNCGLGVCNHTILNCAAGVSQVCDPLQGQGTETCNALDDNCNGETDEDLTQACYSGAAGTQDVGLCKGGARACTGGLWQQCAGEVTPTVEVCDTEDNDCDGSSDEELGQTTCGLGKCRHTVDNCLGGVAQFCDPKQGFSVEVCDSQDNDCDGISDGLTRACYTHAKGCVEVSPEVFDCTGLCATGVDSCGEGGPGDWSGCQLDVGPNPELCDGLDNDCDDEIDEQEGGGVLSSVCYSPGSSANSGCTYDSDSDSWTCQGECATGTRSCEGALWSLCVEETTPTIESCNGKDDDCDGMVDEASDIPGLGQACGDAVGRCTPGVLTCVNGVETCEGGVGPFEGECNWEDDDCDGEVDEANEVGAMQGQVCGESEGACELGATACVQGQIVCSGGVTPSTEVCDCQDNDCDGQVDETSDGALCGEGSSCLDCVCALPCSTASEFSSTCPSGKTAVTLNDGGCYCVGDKCTAAQCAGESVEVDGEVVCAPDAEGVGACVCKNNGCTFPCEGVVCEGGTVCDAQDGRCKADSCQNFPCAEGELCNVESGQCETDLCAEADCADGQGCREGSCFDSCAQVQCGDGEKCAAGSCEADPCAGVSCRAGELCDGQDGECVKNRCQGKVCAAGLVCEPISGDCGLDPCSKTTCPGNQICTAGECELRCKGEEVACGDSCIVPSRDLGYCGASGDCSGDTAGEACSGGQVCANGSCADECQAGAVKCDGVCFDPLNDAEHCGASGDCTGEAAGRACFPGQSCVAGVCMVEGAVGAVTSSGDGDLANLPQENVVVAGGGGCTCAVAVGSQQPRDGTTRSWLLAGMLALFVMRLGRRRRRLADPGLGRQKLVASLLGMVLALFGSGCTSDAFCLTCAFEEPLTATDTDGGSPAVTTVDSGVPPIARPDAGGQDASVSANCEGPEVCNGKDDDCDGEVDEEVDTSSDPNNCGACGNACTPAHAFGACNKGVCGMGGCDVGFHDLDGDGANGCEYGCVKNEDSETLCDLRDNDCDGTLDEGFDLQTDSDHCGQCNAACGYFEGVGSCIGGECTLERCNGQYVDRDGNAGNGCECILALTEGTAATCTENSPGGCGPNEVCADVDDDGQAHCSVIPTDLCDGLDDDCDGSIDEDAPADLAGTSCYTQTVGCTESTPGSHDCVGECKAGALTCLGGVVTCTGQVHPSVEICDTKDNDCDGSDDELFDTDNDSSNCGTCGTQCSVALPNAVPGCSAGACTILACLPGFWNDDGMTDNGCEYECSLTFGGVETCGDGVDNDCDNETDEGFDLMGDETNCGDCGHNCDANKPYGTTVTSCSLGVCTHECLADFIDIDGDLAMGESSSGCEYECVPSNGGVEACDSLDNNCNFELDEDFNKDSNPDNCGACGYRCSDHTGAHTGVKAVDGCVAGICQFECDAGFVDSNGDLGVGSLGDGCDYACVPDNGGVEECDGEDDDCDGAVDEAALGGPLTRGCYTGGGGTQNVGICHGGIETCGAGDYGPCLGQLTEQTELCDGLDNDCDGTPDQVFDVATDVNNCGGCDASCWDSAPLNSVPDACTGGVCSYRCLGTHQDLNGTNMDPSVPVVGDSDGCEYSCPVTPTSEACDGVDNDCDGSDDEDFDLMVDPVNCGTCGTSCEAIKPYGTTSTGCSAGSCTYECLTDFWDVDNDLALGKAGSGCEYSCVEQNDGTETCDGVDEDCDGKLDEDFNKDSSTIDCGSCGHDCSDHLGANSILKSPEGCLLGVCQYECAQGYVDSNGDVSLGDAGDGCDYMCSVDNGGVEECDGEDDDCDGSTDEAASGAPLSRTCYTGGMGTVDVGECRAGTQTCSGGNYGACLGQVVEQSESCDGRDNDCNGGADEPFNINTDLNNCGACDNSCWDSPPPNSYPDSCSGGSCTFRCLSTHQDLNGSNADPSVPQADDVDGCEHTCEVTPIAPEVCDGVDNDCDGQVDNDPPAPVGLCYTGIDGPGTPGTDQNNPCRSVTPSCMDPDGMGPMDVGWHCAYAASVETAPGNADAILGYEAACNGFDGDCDGVPDDDFGVGQVCYTGQGGCQNAGSITCTSGTSAACNAVAGSPTLETCDLEDNDCDGSVDELDPSEGNADQFGAFVYVAGSNFTIFAHEASRPGAEASNAGFGDDGTPCSLPGVMPWSKLTSVDQAPAGDVTAEQACKRLGMGWDLCTDAQWYEACSGGGFPSSGEAFPYGTSYAANSCNGYDYGVGQGEISPVATGTRTMCGRDVGGGTVYDMSGNLKEWVKTGGSFELRGGAYNNVSDSGQAPGLQCDGASPVESGTEIHLPSVGFRCCYSGDIFN